MNQEAQDLLNQLLGISFATERDKALETIQLALQKAYNKGRLAGERSEHNFPRNADMTGR